MATRASDLILARLADLHPKKIDLSLGRVQRLLADLDHPERRLPPVVHVAGTNGKGSTLAMLHAMADAAGLRAHRYISPHLVRFAERIMLHGAPIDEDRLEACLDQVEKVNAGRPITFFEITTATAFLAMAAEPADLVLLETGLGGEFDATNVVDTPLESLITPISMDHEAFLGDTLPRIAAAKAGIIKRGCLAIVGPQREAAAEIVIARAAGLDAPLLLHGRDWQVSADGQDHIVVEDALGTLRLPRPALRGVHQIENGGLAAMAARHLQGFALGEAAIAQGLRRATWPARLQRLTKGPLPAVLAGRHELWLDGGHNPAAGQVLAESLPAIAAGRPVHLVVGMLQTKDFANFLKPLVPLAASITTIAMPHEPESGHDPLALAAEARALGAPAAPAPSLQAALEHLARTQATPALVLICGALYLAGQVLHDNG